MVLFEKVEKLSGIPLDMQMLSYKMHLIHADMRYPFTTVWFTGWMLYQSFSERT